MKFKNIKKEAKENKSPSNFRIISAFTEVTAGKSTTFLRIYRLSLKIFIVFIFILAVVIVGLDLQTNTQAKQAIDLEREKLAKELKFWENFIAKYQNYRDAYFQASILEYRLGDFAKSRQYLNKALELDPNFEKGRILETLLTKFDK